MGIQERKEREKERRRQQIMVAAKRVFIDKGFGRATMEDIAAEAELSSGTIYLYFKNKDELFASTSLRTLQYLFLRIEHLHNEDIDLKFKIAQLSKALLDVYEFDPLILKSLLYMQASDVITNLSPEFLEEFYAMVSKALGKIASIFNQGIEQGICQYKQPKAIAHIVWSLFSGIVLWETGKVTLDEKYELQATLEMAFDILKRGLLAHEGHTAGTTLMSQ
jgi:AcrR family transcriptional regulator